MNPSTTTCEPRAKQRPATRLAHPRNKTRVSNGAEVLPGVDGRTTLGRRFRDIFAQIVADQGGEENLSEARNQLVRRFAASACIAELREADLVLGRPFDVSEHAQLCSTLCRLSMRIGLGRRARDITPSLRTYLDGEKIADPFDEKSNGKDGAEDDE